MLKKSKSRNVDRPEFHIVKYIGYSDYGSRMLTCDHTVPPNRYNERAEKHLRLTGFYHVTQIGVVQCQKALINALVERWHPDTHTFHLSVGECAVTLKDVAMIFGLSTDGLPVTGMTLSSFDGLEAECLHQFRVLLRKLDCRGSGIKLTTILFGDKVGASVHWKYLPLLNDFASIGQYSWGSACLAHLYRSLCRASRFDCKEIDGPLTLLLCWAWMRLPYLAPVPKEPRSFPLANRWQNWERGDRVYRFFKLAHFRKALDELQEGQFVWVAYSADRVDPDIVPGPTFRNAS
ncbi:protein MAIN-LIKE 1-like [Arachis hypogaea]|uniref:protein MAIN-LIKE 1-like n=1 Tax=Arachis hypogaea TaxID=3818 RepID=UPI000DEC5ECD|nr:protein MAIN-LIKE 1-like [Arachis hypogaea]